MKKLSQLLVGLLLVVSMAFGLAACERVESVQSDPESIPEPVYAVELSADKTTALRGDEITLNTVVTCDGEVVEDASVIVGEDVLPVFEIVAGEDHASIDGNVITVLDTAPHGLIIKAQATLGELTSNVVEISVSVPVESIVASANGVTNVLAGNSVILSKTVTPADANVSGMTWVITEGNDICAISGDVLIVNQKAETGSVIKVKAVCGDVESAELTLIVGFPVESISISANGVTNVLAGNSVMLTKTVTPEDASTKGVSWVIVEGDDLCTIAGDVLTVKQGVATGSEIKVKAVCGNVESEVITLIVGIPVETITISAIGSTEIVKGNTAQLSMSITPANASEKDVTWVLVQDGDYAELVEKTLYVKASAPTGATIKVKAVSGSVESSEITFTVMPTQYEINATKYKMSLTADEITLDKNAASYPVLGVEILDGNYEDVYDAEVVFDIISGAEFVTMSVDGYTCSFTPVAHGETVVRAYIVGTEEEVEATIHSIVPPDVVKLPAVFAQRVGFKYNFAKESVIDGTVYTLPFVPYVDQDGVCTDLRISFTHADGTSGDAVATYDYDKQEITFHKLGEVTVYATSDSGSRKETSVSYTFNINEGINVYSFEDAAKTTNSKAYTGQVINFVALTNFGTLTEYAQYLGVKEEHYYAFIPEFSLKFVADQTPEEALNSSKARIIAVNKSLYVNGNRHVIDGSNVRTFSQEEVEAYNNKYNRSFKLHGGILSAEPWMSDASDVKGTFHVNVYDLTIKGNCPIDYDKATPTWSAGCYQVGLNIGQVEYSAQYYADVKNVTVLNSYQGLALKSVVGNSVFENIEVSNIYATGITIKSSILTLKNTKFGPCGAVGVELVPDDSDKAGVNENEKQTVTFAGEIDAVGNLLDGQTKYMNYYTIEGLGIGIPPIIAGTIAGINNDNKISHVMNEKQQFVLVTFMLKGMVDNESVALYPAYQAGGIIDAEDLPENGYDTTHEFVRVQIDFKLPDNMGGGILNLGSALMYNLHYGETVTE